MDVPEGEEPPSRGKRKRIANQDDPFGDNRKHRGRPRVERQDETAADRRRTQIRLAQRAYRQRKETTISSLQKQVSQLQSTISEMSKSFLQFNDRAVSSGNLQLQPELACELERTAKRFILLGRAASSAGAGSNEESADDDETVVAPEARGARLQAGATGELVKHLRPAISSGTEPGVVGAVDIGWGYQRIYYGSGSVGQQPLGRSTHVHRSDVPVVSSGFMCDSSATTQSAPQLFRTSRTSFIQGLHQHRTTPPSPPDSLSDHTAVVAPANLNRPSEPRSPYTYSFQETTFARRLQRAALERGFHLLSHPHADPAVVQDVFKICLQHRTPAELHASFRAVLLRSTSESLEFSQGPFVHLGGAGTHYPHKDQRGSAIQPPPPQSFNERGFGLCKLTSDATVTDVEDRGVNPPSGVDLRGFEGEWFDAQDVEGYLEEKGVRIDPQASFSDAEVLRPASLVATASGSALNGPEPAGGERVPEQSASMAPAALDIENYHWRPSDTALPADSQGVDTMPFTSMDFGLPSFDSNSSSSHETVLIPQDHFVHLSVAKVGEMRNLVEPVMTNPFRVVERQTITIDVTKLLDELIKRAVCLGRAPGFRRRDVDFAFNAAMMHVC